MKKLLSALLVLIMSLSGTMIAYDQTDGEIFFVEDLFGDEDFVSYFEERLVEAFGEEYLKNLGPALQDVALVDSMFPQNRMGEPIYPDFFGGMYLGLDGNLVVQVVNTNESLRAAASFLFDGLIPNSIRIGYVDFSYNELNRVMDDVNAYFEANYETRLSGKFNYIGVDIMHNRVFVALRYYSDEIISYFRENVVDSPTLVFYDAANYRFCGRGGFIPLRTPFSPPDIRLYEMTNDR